MATVHRDYVLPPDWSPGAEFRLTAGVHRCPDGTMRANTWGFVHRICRDPPEGNPHQPVPQADIWWDVTAVHRIKKKLRC